MIEYIITAIDADGEFIERATVSSESQFAAHREAKAIGEAMVQRGAYNAVVTLDGKDVGLVPGWCEPPPECWPADYWLRVRAVHNGMMEMCSDDPLPQA